MPNIVTDTFETGAFAAGWNAGQTTDSGNLSVLAGAALHGSYGMRAYIPTTTTEKFTEWTGGALTTFRVRFYVDPNSISMPASSSIVLFVSLDAAWNSAVTISLEYLNGAYTISVLDSTDGAYTSLWKTAISDAPHCVEVNWKAATAPAANDGKCQVWIDGAPVGSYITIDSDTETITRMRFGAMNIPANVTGTIYLDDFQANNDGAVIGTIAAAATEGLQLNVGDAWKAVDHAKINIADEWRPVGKVYVNIGDAWKEAYSNLNLGIVIFSGSSDPANFDGYVDELLVAGITHLRVDNPNYENTSWLAQSKAAVLRAIAKGAKVTWGVSTGVGLTAANYEAFRTAVKSAATWANGKGLYEFQLGNEEELHVDGTTLTLATMQGHIKSVATEVRAILTDGTPITYATAALGTGVLAGWLSIGRGTDIDLLTWNLYANENNWQGAIRTVLSTWGTDHSAISEFSLSDDNTYGLDAYTADQTEQKLWIAQMLQWLQSAGVIRAFFHCYNHPLFGARDAVEGGSYRELWDTLNTWNV